MDIVKLAKLLHIFFLILWIGGLVALISFLRAGIDKAFCRRHYFTMQLPCMVIAIALGVLLLINDPTKLRFDLSGTGSATLQAQGGGEKLTVYGVIYAPKRPLDINGGGGAQVEIFGGLIGNNVKINAVGAKIHADVALNGVGGPPPPPPPGSVSVPTQRLWRETP